MNRLLVFVIWMVVGVSGSLILGIQPWYKILVYWIVLAMVRLLGNFEYGGIDAR